MLRGLHFCEVNIHPSSQSYGLLGHEGCCMQDAIILHDAYEIVLGWLFLG